MSTTSVSTYGNSGDSSEGMPTPAFCSWKSIARAAATPTHAIAAHAGRQPDKITIASTM